MREEKHLISIVGPTAIGKTNLAIALSKKYQAPILSSDSRQFYKEMTIGTAVPNAEELAAAPHYFIQHKSIETPYSVGDYEKDAMAFLKNHYLNHQLAILVGGSGLYTDAVCKGLDRFPEIPEELRTQLNEQFAKEGLASLTSQLSILDPKIYDTIDLDNPMRVIRALSVCKASGVPYSSFLNQEKETRPFTTHTLNISAPRETLYERINLRVDLMMQNGLEEEARALFPKKELNALNTVGYKELFSHFEDKIPLESAVEEIKKNTRRFAKRQMTWNRKNPDAVAINYKHALEESIAYLDKRIPPSEAL